MKNKYDIQQYLKIKYFNEFIYKLNKNEIIYINYHDFKYFCTKKCTYQKYITIFEFEYLNLKIIILPILQKPEFIYTAYIKKYIILKIIKNNKIIFENKNNKQIKEIKQNNEKIIQINQKAYLFIKLYNGNILNNKYYKLLKLYSQKSKGRGKNKTIFHIKHNDEIETYTINPQTFQVINFDNKIKQMKRRKNYGHNEILD